MYWGKVGKGTQAKIGVGGARTHTSFKSAFPAPQPYSAGFSSLDAVSPSVVAGAGSDSSAAVFSAAGAAVELLLLLFVSSSSFFSSSEAGASTLSSFAPFSVASDDS